MPRFTAVTFFFINGAWVGLNIFTFNSLSWYVRGLARAAAVLEVVQGVQRPWQCGQPCQGLLQNSISWGLYQSCSGQFSCNPCHQHLIGGPLPPPPFFEVLLSCMFSQKVQGQTREKGMPLAGRSLWIQQFPISLLNVYFLSFYPHLSL